MSGLSSALFGGRLRNVLAACFVLVAVVTAALNTLVISRVIDEYLTAAQSNRVSRDLELAAGMYQEKLAAVAGSGRRLARDPQTTANLSAALTGDPDALVALEESISRNSADPVPGSSEVVLILNVKGDVVTGRIQSAEGQSSSPRRLSSWGSLPIVADALISGEPIMGTEVIPVSFLRQVGLDRQAYVALRATPLAAPAPFDPREGTAGLALVSVHPLRNEGSRLVGMVLTAYLFNNDPAFVDYLTTVARIETATIFLGDLRVSTNVVDDAGTRAVGTRVSQAVYDPVLKHGQVYFGRVFVVGDWYIGDYQPLRDHRGDVVGMLYVGAREATFRNLVDNFTRQATWIALVCIAVAGILALPISQWIARPISDLARATRRLADGDMSVRIQPYGKGEIAQLEQSFNSMVVALEDSQKELLRKDKLASMGQLAAGVAHELNNPLGTILLYSDAMYSEAAASDPRREDLKMIIGEANRCKVIVGDLLNFARQHDVLAQDTDLNSLLRDVVEKIRQQPRFEHIEVMFQLDPALPPIQADPAQLQQVFINLLNNAADAISGKGTIILATSIVDNDKVEVRLVDTGSGIPPEDLDKLFTPFFTTKPLGKGTGLGLAIVYGIIKMHRGQVRVESTLGQGTTIIINLPIHSAGAAAPGTVRGSDVIA